MGADQIGFLFKGPIKLDTTRTTTQLAIERGKKVVEAIRWLAAHGHLPDHLSDSLSHLDGDTVDEFVQDPGSVPDPERTVKDLIEWWHGSARDTCKRLDPDDKEQIIGFAGEMSWGDEPSGRGYQILRDAHLLNVPDLFEIK